MNEFEAVRTEELQQIEGGESATCIDGKALIALIKAIVGAVQKAFG